MLPTIVRTVCNKSAVPKKTLGLLSKNTFATEATFDTKPFRLHRLEDPPAATSTLTRDDGIKYFSQMHAIRRMETQASNLYKEKLIRGFCHLYTGQEAVAVGCVAALRPQDAVITSYRSHGWTYLMGVTPEGVMGELCGKKSGCARGKGGSMHMYNDNFYGGNGIVGAQVAIGAGVAWAAKYKGTDGVCIALYGDGAANQGQIFEAYNMAALWNLPCIFVCENNGYGMGTTVARASAVDHFYTRGDFIPGIFVDGMDVLSVKECFKYAVDYCASGKGPLVIEAATYRFVGHSMSDPGTSYRTREEVQQMRQTRDPINSLKEMLVSTNLATAEELKKLEVEIKANIDQVTKDVRAEKEIGMDELAADIYALNLEHTIRNVDPYSPLQHKRIGPALNLN